MVHYLRDTGMPIQQLLLYTELGDAGEETIPQRMALLAEHEKRVSERIEQLRRQREQVRQKIGWYREHLAAYEAKQATR
jgi:DNA-binding transcriptional MerR regulator